MTYVSLYRKWRPQTFADVVGQDHVVGTLVNAIQTGQVHHALLFTGTRGTGKTSTARILAKALNCERGPTPEPCNQCDACRSITDGTSLDVVEIDAASHGSVDDARDLREKANYAPAASRFKVYIVDEAHMVTPQGFNAMLKVLEEPPDHVRFVFCTTEPHKVIEAIRSRCQRHDFRRVRTAVLAEYFAKICAAEGVDIEPAAIEMIARAADGSVRDGQSRLDQVITFSRGRVTLSSVTQALGLLPSEVRFELAEAIASQRVADVFACVERVVDAGHDLQQFTREALEHLRDLYVTRIAPDSSTLVDVTPETRARLASQADRFGPGELNRALRIFGEVYLDMRSATDQRLILEVGMARAAMPEASLDAEALLARIERLERRLAIAGDQGAPAPVAEQPAARAPAAGTGGTTPAAEPPADGAAAEPGRAAAGSGRAAAKPTRRREAAAEPPTGAEPAGGASGGSGPAAGGGRAGGASGASSPAAGATDSSAGGAGDGPGAAPARGGAARSRRTAAEPEVEDDWAAPPQVPAGPIDLALVSRSWAEVVQRVQAASKVTATFLERGRLTGLENRQVLVEFSPDDRFHAEALGKNGRDKHVEAALEAVIGGGLGFRVVIGDTPAAAPAGAEPAAEAPSGEPAGPPVAGPSAVDEFEIDPANDQGEPLDSDADARAVADWAARELGGQVIEEHPNQASGGRRPRTPKSRERSERGRR
jgi:DNA polymerase-3 subunit gamma/tau